MLFIKAIKKIIESEPPHLHEEERWSRSFKSFLNDCLQKSPSDRLSAEELLKKHEKFFSIGDEREVRMMIESLESVENKAK